MMPSSSETLQSFGEKRMTQNGDIIKTENGESEELQMPSIDDDLPLLLTTETSTNGTGTDEASTTNGTEDERWLELELEMLERMSVRTQTVEEILAEKNEFALDEEEFLLSTQGGDDGFSAATGLGLQLPPMGRYGAVSTELPSSYTLDSPLVLSREDVISRQLAALDPTKHGQPTAICVGRKFLAVGTSRGHCFLFEKMGPAQKMVYSIIPSNPAFGSISCLDFSPDESRICAGFSTGALLVFNCQGANGKVLVQSNDVIQPGRGLLHVKYISTHTILLVDNGGNVYEFHERRQQKRKENVRCLFTGCKGEVTNIAFVHTPEEGIELLILATFYQALLLSVKRRGATIGQVRLHGSPLLPPLIDWRERRIKLSHTSVHDLRVCIGRDCEVRIYQVRQRVGGDLLFPHIQTIRFGCSLINLKWLEHGVLLAMSSENGAEQLQLVEIPSQTASGQKSQRKISQNDQNAAVPLARQDIASTVHLVYNSADFKGLATGKNVSKAMQELADSVCHHSVARNPADDCVYLLGHDGIFLVHLMEQSEQFELLMKRADFASALLFLVDICSGRVRDRTKSRETATNFRTRAFKEIPSLVELLLEQTLDGLESGRIDELIAHYKRNFYVLIRACLITSHFDLLYNLVYARIQKDTLCRSIFLELLEEFVLEGQLHHPPPTLVNDYLNYLLAEGQLPQFEQSITKLPVECMDLHQVMSACREHQLFDGISHVMNNAMRDYISPLQEMFEQMQRFVYKEVLSDLEVAQGNKLLLYLSCCLAGRAYPFGELPDEHLVQTVPLETYKFLVQLRPSFTIAATPSPCSSTSDGCGGSSPGPSTSIFQSQQQRVDLRRFPHLNILLRFDAQQFLNVISTCADAPVFAQNGGRLKRLVDVFISMCVEEDEELHNQLGPLLIGFVGALLQKGAIPRDVFLLTQLIVRVLERGFHENVRAQKSAEQKIVELLKVVPEIELDRVLEAAQKLPYVHVCAYIFTVRKQYIQLLECCMKDPFEPLNVFPILADLLVSLRESEQQEELRQFVRQQLTHLAAFDAEQTAQLLLGHFPELLTECQAMPRKLPLNLLRECIKIRREQGYRTLTGGEEEQDEQLFSHFFETTIQQAPPNEPLDALDLELADHLRYWLPIGAFTDHCLNVAMQKQPLVECSALLLVARGHIGRAFEHLFNEGILNKQQKPKRLERCLNSMLELAVAYPVEARAGNWLPKLFRHLLHAIPLADEGQKQGGEVLPTHQLLRPNSHLSRVFTAIMEQPHAEEEDEWNTSSKEGSSSRHSTPGAPRKSAETVGENLLPMVALMAELFEQEQFRQASFHHFQGIFRQMLLWCEIRALMQRSTRDCVAWELTERWRRVAWTKTAFACTSDANSRRPSSQKTENNEEIPQGTNQQVCKECGRPIAKSCFLFPCGHCLHMECAPDHRPRRCPCEMEKQDASKERSDRANHINELQYQSASLNSPLERGPTEEEKRAISAIFGCLERDFKLRTGPPPPALPSTDQKRHHQPKVPMMKSMAHSQFSPASTTATIPTTTALAPIPNAH